MNFQQAEVSGSKQRDMETNVVKPDFIWDFHELCNRACYVLGALTGAIVYENVQVISHN